MGEDDFEFEFFPEERPAATGDDWISWDEDHGSDLHDRPAPATAGRPSPQIIMRRRVAAATVIALVLLIILLIVLTQESSGGGASHRYLVALAPIAAHSEQTGASLAATLSGSGGGGKKNLVTKLDQFVQQAVADTARLQVLTPPAALQAEQQQALTALDLRLQGLQGIRDSLSQAIQSQVPRTWLPVLSGQVDHLVTSDEIWNNLVRASTNSVLQANGIGGAFAPQSHFVTDHNALLTSIENLLQPTTNTSKTLALVLGAKGTAVVTWQNQLNQWLQLTAPTQTPLTPDGTFGTATLTATQALQTAQGLTPDGVVGPKTRQALQTALTNDKASATRTG